MSEGLRNVDEECSLRGRKRILINYLIGIHTPKYQLKSHEAEITGRGNISFETQDEVSAGSCDQAVKTVTHPSFVP